jgi:hypothetical protein
MSNLWVSWLQPAPPCRFWRTGSRVPPSRRLGTDHPFRRGIGAQAESKITAPNEATLRGCHQRRLRSAISACPPLWLWGSSASRVRRELRVLSAMGAGVAICRGCRVRGTGHSFHGYRTQSRTKWRNTSLNCKYVRAVYRNRTDDLRITRVFPCVACGFKACAGFMFASCWWWRSLAVDGCWGGSSGARS